jgi:hypothetical protein
MKSLSLGILLTVGSMGVATAQSTVTLYGLADAGFVYNNNSGGAKLYLWPAGTNKVAGGACEVLKTSGAG